ncbi:hypothetical protein A9200_01855 [Maribacter hydrothermalis]|uniref:Uncharacterized protein n=1 Tax=Maribacter hydrothermalis TaxID=1836467 RepID=A0A1B7ZF18_9FLAO|nr:hypothetical protein BTR34_10230 [Maribacter hydrothermalis]OBR42157.1 hypothetical protein A9200_01855 [Maribacter hydrothermalis]
MITFTILKAIHNKDYSVVKTFKPPRLPIRGIFFGINLNVFQMDSDKRKVKKYFFRQNIGIK